MKKIAIGSMLAALAAACGGGENNAPDARVIVTDGGGPDAAAACDPSLQTGCQAGEKCAWIRLASTEQSQIGALGCVPAGNVAVDGACQYGASGQATGYDNCEAGLTCLANVTVEAATGTCRDTCTISALTEVDGACGPQRSCIGYQTYFANGDEQAMFGVCNPQCDPVTQELLDPSLTPAERANCGGPDLGCYGIPSITAKPSSYICAADRNPENTHRAVLDQENLSLNICAAGYQLVYFEDWTGTNLTCFAFCGPTPISMENGEDDPANFGGDTVTCSDRGADAPQERCIHSWFFEGTMTPITENSDEVGFCFDHSKFKYDSDGDEMIDNGDDFWPGPETLPKFTEDPDDLDAASFAFQPTSVFPPAAQGASRPTVFQKAGIRVRVVDQAEMATN